MKRIRYIIYFIFLLISLINSEVSKKNHLSETIDDELVDLDGEYQENITLNDENNKTYIFQIKNSDYIYIFESYIDGYIHYDEDISCPNLCIVQADQEIHENIIYINYYKNATGKEIKISITSVKNFEGEILSLKSMDYNINAIRPIKSLKSIFIFESYSDYIFYFKSIDESISVKCTEYQKDMQISDILDANDNYFSDCNNRINELKQSRIYIFSIVAKSYNKPLETLLKPKLDCGDNLITNSSDFFYLANQADGCTLDFSVNEGIEGIALSRFTVDSEITIEESDTNEKIILNKDNLYYIFGKNESYFNKTLNIKVTKGAGALLEFLSQFREEKYENNITILNESEYINYKIESEAILIKFENNHKNKFINFKIFSGENKEFTFSMTSGYAKGKYFHNSLSNQLSKLKEDHSYSSEIKIYNEAYDLEEGEYFYLFLNFEKEKISDESYTIYLNKIDKYTTDDLNVYISEEKCKLVIESFKKLYQDGYVYTEIKKKPPNPDYFEPADLISDLNNIKTKDRKYYDFYRDIREIVGKMRDLHLSMIATISPNGYTLGTMIFCLPFYFKIVGTNKENSKIYIEKYNSCFSFYNNEIQEFIENHTGKYVKSINKTDPFEYIQNFNHKFRSCYNKHSTFTMNMHTRTIGIRASPLTSQELSNIEFIFEGEEGKDDTITLDYYLYYNEKDKNNKELMNLYNEENKKNSKVLNTKSFLEIRDEWIKRNNLNNKNLNDEKTEIKWDYSTNDTSKSIKCRFDEEKKINVFIQKSFYFLGEEYDNSIETVEKCTELFYSNPYPIVGIESLNGGGICKLSFYFQELLQAKILPVHHNSVKLSKLMQEYVEADIPVITTDPDMYERIDIETCKPFSKFEDMKEIVDDYGDGVTHTRSQYFGIFNSTDLKKHKKRRENYFNKNNLKKPTEILIFTDAYSYSATSFFIKGLQETGAAITVGYYGNPKSDEIFDASQAPSFVGDFSNSDIAENLLKCGFQITGVTIYETYNYTYQTKNPTPRDYLIHPVDERIDIYQDYDDTLYDVFMEKAKEILKKYNDDQVCNPDNLNLLYDPNNKKDCYVFENDSHAHGGYECDPVTKKWSKECKPYYCDIGYFFDKYQNICIKDICTEEDENKNKGGLKAWHIILIVVGGVLLLLVIVFIILKCRKPKEEESTGETGPLIDQVELKDNE